MDFSLTYRKTERHRERERRREREEREKERSVIDREKRKVVNQITLMPTIIGKNILC